MEKVIGFIGAGNMGSALISGIISSGFVKRENIIASAKSDHTISRLNKDFGIKTTKNNIDVARKADILTIAVKPYMYLDIINEIKLYIKDDPIVISIAAGKDIRFIEENIGRNIKVVKAMPNTPSMVGEGMTAISTNNLLVDEEKEMILDLFKSLGRAQLVDESLIDAVTAVSGSSPAYVYMFIEALADGAVLHGMPREMAYEFAAQSVLGSAKMVLDTKMHPGKLKDNVCSPGGATIEAVAKLEERGFRSSIIESMKVCYEKSVEMGK